MQRQKRKELDVHHIDNISTLKRLCKENREQSESNQSKSLSDFKNSYLKVIII